jgi:hypothetical protein
MIASHARAAHRCRLLKRHLVRDLDRVFGIDESVVRERTVYASETDLGGLWAESGWVSEGSQGRLGRFVDHHATLRGDNDKAEGLTSHHGVDTAHMRLSRQLASILRQQALTTASGSIDSHHPVTHLEQPSSLRLLAKLDHHASRLMTPGNRQWSPERTVRHRRVCMAETRGVDFDEDLSGPGNRQGDGLDGILESVGLVSG